MGALLPWGLKCWGKATGKDTVSLQFWVILGVPVASEMLTKELLGTKTLKSLSCECETQSSWVFKERRFLYNFTIFNASNCTLDQKTDEEWNWKPGDNLRIA